MKQNQIILATLVATVLATASAQAQYLNTFDTSSSVDAGSRNYSPPPIGVAFDYGGFTPSLTESVNYSSTVNDTAGNPSSGSVQLNWNFAASDGGASAAFTFDLFPTAQTFTSLSFDIMVAPSSTPDSYCGYGYFQVATRDGSYGFNDTGFSQELANPGYGSPSSPGAGVWQHITINLSGADSSVRALTLQDYADGQGTGRAITGSETIYIDNLNLTAPVPEPTTITLIGLGMTGLLFIRRNRKS